MVWIWYAYGKEMGKIANLWRQSMTCLSSRANGTSSATLNPGSIRLREALACYCT